MTPPVAELLFAVRGTGAVVTGAHALYPEWTRTVEGQLFINFGSLDAPECLDAPEWKEPPPGRFVWGDAAYAAVSALPEPDRMNERLHWLPRLVRDLMLDHADVRATLLEWAQGQEDLAAAMLCTVRALAEALRQREGPRP